MKSDTTIHKSTTLSRLSVECYLACGVCARCVVFRFTLLVSLSVRPLQVHYGFTALLVVRTAERNSLARFIGMIK